MLKHNLHVWGVMLKHNLHVWGVMLKHNLHVYMSCFGFRVSCFESHRGHAARYAVRSSAFWLTNSRCRAFTSSFRGAIPPMAANAAAQPEAWPIAIAGAIERAD